MCSSPRQIEKNKSLLTIEKERYSSVHIDHRSSKSNCLTQNYTSLGVGPRLEKLVEALDQATAYLSKQPGVQNKEQQSLSPKFD